MRKDPKKGGKKKKKASVGQVPGYNEIVNRFKGKYKVTPKKNKPNQYTLTDKSGNTVSYTPGRKKKSNKFTVKSVLSKKSY